MLELNKNWWMTCLALLSTVVMLFVFFITCAKCKKTGKKKTGKTTTDKTKGFDSRKSIKRVSKLEPSLEIITEEQESERKTDVSETESQEATGGSSGSIKDEKDLSPLISEKMDELDTNKYSEEGNISAPEEQASKFDNLESILVVAQGGSDSAVCQSSEEAPMIQQYNTSETLMNARLNRWSDSSGRESMELFQGKLLEWKRAGATQQFSGTASLGTQGTLCRDLTPNITSPNLGDDRSSSVALMDMYGTQSTPASVEFGLVADVAQSKEKNERVMGSSQVSTDEQRPSLTASVGRENDSTDVEFGLKKKPSQQPDETSLKPISGEAQNIQDNYIPLDQQREGEETPKQTTTMLVSQTSEPELLDDEYQIIAPAAECIEGDKELEAKAGLQISKMSRLERPGEVMISPKTRTCDTATETTLAAGIDNYSPEKRQALQSPPISPSNVSREPLLSAPSYVSGSVSNEIKGKYVYNSWVSRIFANEQEVQDSSQNLRESRALGETVMDILSVFLDAERLQMQSMISMMSCGSPSERVQPCLATVNEKPLSSDGPGQGNFGRRCDFPTDNENVVGLKNVSKSPATFPCVGRPRCYSPSRSLVGVEPTEVKSMATPNSCPFRGYPGSTLTCMTGPDEPTDPVTISTSPDETVVKHPLSQLSFTPPDITQCYPASFPSTSQAYTQGFIANIDNIPDYLDQEVSNILEKRKRKFHSEAQLNIVLHERNGADFQDRTRETQIFDPQWYTRARSAFAPIKFGDSIYAVPDYITKRLKRSFHDSPIRLDELDENECHGERPGEPSIAAELAHCSNDVLPRYNTCLQQSEDDRSMQPTDSISIRMPIDEARGSPVRLNIGLGDNCSVSVSSTFQALPQDKEPLPCVSRGGCYTNSLSKFGQEPCVSRSSIKLGIRLDCQKAPPPLTLIIDNNQNKPSCNSVRSHANQPAFMLDSSYPSKTPPNELKTLGCFDDTKLANENYSYPKSKFDVSPSSISPAFKGRPEVSVGENFYRAVRDMARDINSNQITENPYWGSLAEFDPSGVKGFDVLNEQTQRKPSTSGTEEGTIQVSANQHITGSEQNTSVLLAPEDQVKFCDFDDFVYAFDNSLIQMSKFTREALALNRLPSIKKGILNDSNNAENFQLRPEHIFDNFATHSSFGRPEYKEGLVPKSSCLANHSSDVGLRVPRGWEEKNTSPVSFSLKTDYVEISMNCDGDCNTGFKSCEAETTNTSESLTASTTSWTNGGHVRDTFTETDLQKPADMYERSAMTSPTENSTWTEVDRPHVTESSTSALNSPVTYDQGTTTFRLQSRWTEVEIPPARETTTSPPTPPILDNRQTLTSPFQRSCWTEVDHVPARNESTSPQVSPYKYDRGTVMSPRTQSCWTEVESVQSVDLGTSARGSPVCVDNRTWVSPQPQCCVIDMEEILTSDEKTSARLTPVHITVTCPLHKTDDKQDMQSSSYSAHSKPSTLLGDPLPLLGENIDEPKLLNTNTFTSISSANEFRASLDRNSTSRQTPSEKYVTVSGNRMPSRFYSSPSSRIPATEYLTVGSASRKQMQGSLSPVPSISIQETPCSPTMQFSVDVAYGTKTQRTPSPTPYWTDTSPLPYQTNHSSTMSVVNSGSQMWFPYFQPQQQDPLAPNVPIALRENSESEPGAMASFRSTRQCYGDHQNQMPKSAFATVSNTKNETCFVDMNKTVKSYIPQRPEFQSSAMGQEDCLESVVVHSDESSSSNEMLYERSIFLGELNKQRASPDEQSFSMLRENDCCKSTTAHCSFAVDELMDGNEFVGNKHFKKNDLCVPKSASDSIQCFKDVPAFNPDTLSKLNDLSIISLPELAPTSPVSLSCCKRKRTDHDNQESSDRQENKLANWVSWSSKLKAKYWK